MSDSCAFWGHNEADLGTWRAPRYKFRRPFVEEYQKAMGISEPRGDWDDWNALYAMYVLKLFPISIFLAILLSHYLFRFLSCSFPLFQLHSH